MKTYLNNLILYASLNRQNIQLLLLLVSLFMLVIGAGAPIGGGDGTPGSR